MSWPAFWKRKTWQSYLLSPLSSLVCWEAARRLKNFQQQNVAARQTQATVIVVGNVVVGGTGKTPFIVWLADQLKQSGFSVGILSRGYGAKNKEWPRLVSVSDTAETVGDEPLMLSQKTNCPVAVSPKRTEALALLTEQHDCDYVISDDGLQHYALQRDIEVVMIDAERQFGNQMCMPSGPLREPLSRIEEVDFCVWNGLNENEQIPQLVYQQKTALKMQLLPVQFHKVADLQTSLSIEAFVAQFSQQETMAIAGIGNPQRFFNTLAELSLEFKTTAFADHHAFSRAELVGLPASSSGNPIIMTEKDAVKCQDFAEASDEWWYLKVETACSPSLVQAIITKHLQLKK